MATPDQATGIPTGNTDRTAVREETVTIDISDEAPAATTGMPGRPDTSDGAALHGVEKTVNDTLTAVGMPSPAAGVPAAATADAARVTTGYADPLPDIRPDTRAGRWTEMREGSGGTPHRDVTHRGARGDPE